jgi:hypothetical protein
MVEPQEQASSTSASGPAALPLPAPPQAAASPSNTITAPTSPPESKTICPTPATDDKLSDDEATEGVAVAVVVSASSAAAVAPTKDPSLPIDSNITYSTTKPPSHPRSLRERSPSTDAVLQEVRLLHTIQKIFENSTHFNQPADQEQFFNIPQLWSAVADKLIKAITKYTPKEEKDVTRKSDQFERKKNELIDYFIGAYELFPLQERE